MDDFIWTPPGISEDDAATFLETREGIPENARPQILRWLIRDKYDHESVNLDEYLKFQTALRRSLGLLPGKSATTGTVREWLAGLDEGTLTALVDFRLSSAYPLPSFNPRPQREVAAMKEILYSAGSSWTVGDRNDRWGLIEALPGAVLDAAQVVVS